VVPAPTDGAETTSRGLLLIHVGPGLATCPSTTFFQHFLQITLFLNFLQLFNLMASLCSDNTSAPSAPDGIVDEGIVHDNNANTFQHSHRVTNMTMMELLLDVSPPPYQDLYAFHDVPSNNFLDGYIHTPPGDVMRSAGAAEASEPMGVGVEHSVHEDNGINFQHSHWVTNMTMMELLLGVSPPPFQDFDQVNDMEPVMETEKEIDGDSFP
jgi:hypothetical protein